MIKNAFFFFLFFLMITYVCEESDKKYLVINVWFKVIKAKGAIMKFETGRLY